MSSVEDRGRREAQEARAAAIALRQQHRRAYAASRLAERPTTFAKAPEPIRRLLLGVPEHLRDAAAETIDLARRIESLEDRPPPYFRDDGRPWTQAGVPRSARGAGKGGVPAHHPRRCHSLSDSGWRCKHWAEKGRLNCKHHGGASRLMPPIWKDMPSAYSKHLAPTLRERLDEFLGCSDRQEQLRLYDEIALARALLTQTLDTYTGLAAAKESGVRGVELAHLMTCREAIGVQMDRVADLCAKCANVEKHLQDRVGVEQLGAFVEDIVRAIHRRLGDSDVARQLADDLKDRVRLPQAGLTDPRVTVRVEYDDV